ncbi:NAD(P)/FAD-dependent oxidoreductase [Rhizobium halophytocola]|uniref:Thioredoxin reductase n=1 Tax=Rhizobium halophytocola TaxID=735519 RepID=A0ABS4E6M5_9HYPH|nr:NAD(P)/FAD-dependent oxidoreductase [Rhizobium halophytocola]MBP1853562.1 thioredoxin reductase [Rhizobium halophytocola]
MSGIYDVVVIGGSFAGLSAAMQLVRARRRVLVIDAGKPRNRFAQAAHGFLGQDGVSPAQIRSTAMEQLRRYPSFSELDGEVIAARRETAGFAVSLAGDRMVLARRLILAVGVRDDLPEIEGLAPLWGTSVLHCPYCHGYEIGGGPIGLLASSPLAHHQAALLPDWGETTVFLEPGIDFADDERALMARRGVHIEREKVVRLVADGKVLQAAELADGRRVPIKALFVQSKVVPAAPLAAELGAEMAEGPQGPHIRIDDWGATTVSGLFAAGDAATPMHNATFASAAGVKAGVMAHRSLIWED